MSDQKSGSSPDENYVVDIKGPDLTFKRSVGEQTARDILNILLGGHGGTPARETVRGGVHPIGSSHGPQRLSLREYLEEVSAARNPDIITAIASYLRDVEGRSEFASDDVKSKFKSAGVKSPANFGRDFAATISAGWIAQDHESEGMYYLTKAGDKAIQQKFSKEVRKPVNPSRKGGRKKAKGGGE